MAHKYSSFGDAFYNLESHWVTGKSNHDSAMSEHTAALAHYQAGEDHLAIGHILNCEYFNTYALRCITAYDEATSDQSELMESLYWLNQAIVPYTLDMLKLIAAMSIAKPTELMTFICLVDAYRAALWDAPYNDTYFATMVKAFKSWV
jgi:hypothetical protein